MVLCPFVFLLLRHDIPPLTLQPTEVHSTHWVPIRSLLSPALQSIESAEISDRLKVQQRSPLIRALLRIFIGRLIFTSRLLTPSESLHSTSTLDNLPTTLRTAPATNNTTITSDKPFTHLTERLSLTLRSLTRRQNPSASGVISGPYPLWGLTLGIVADLLHQLSSFSSTTSTSTDTSSLWSWPTFSHWDIRFILWLLTYRIRRREDTGLATRDHDAEPRRAAAAQTEIKGIDGTTSAVSAWRPSPAAAQLPDEYFRLMRTAVVYALLLRASAALIAIPSTILAARWYYRRRAAAAAVSLLRK